MMESTYARGGIQDRIPPGEASRSRGHRHQALWQQFAAADTPESYCQSWLALQCGLISGVSTGVVMLKMSAALPLRPWLSGLRCPRTGDTWRRWLSGCSWKAAVWSSGVSRQALTMRRRRCVTTWPILCRLKGACTVSLPLILLHARHPNDKLSCGNCSGARPGSHCSFSGSDRPCRPHRRGTAQAVLELLATLLEHPRVQAAATAFVTALTTRLACDRVSLGFVHRGRCACEPSRIVPTLGREPI